MICKKNASYIIVKGNLLYFLISATIKLSPNLYNKYLNRLGFYITELYKTGKINKNPFRGEISSIPFYVLENCVIKYCPMYFQRRKHWKRKKVIEKEIFKSNQSLSFALVVSPFFSPRRRHIMRMDFISTMCTWRDEKKSVAKKLT